MLLSGGSSPGSLYITLPLVKLILGISWLCYNMNMNNESLQLSMTLRRLEGAAADASTKARDLSIDLTAKSIEIEQAKDEACQLARSLQETLDSVLGLIAPRT